MSDKAGIDNIKLLSDIVKSIVDHPDDVVVHSGINGNTETLTLKVNSEDMGMVIGRHGNIAKSIRSVMKASGKFSGKKIIVDIK